jgi:RND family efflux transporter MFP subunit
VDDLLRLGLNNASWAAALAVVAAIGARVWKNRPALAHALWLLVLLKLATPSLVAVDLPSSVWVNPRPQDIDQHDARTAQEVPTFTAASQTRRSAQSLRREPNGFNAESNASSSQASRASRLRPTAGGRPWRTALGLFWLVGAGVWWSCVALSVSRFHRLLNSASSASGDLRDRMAHIAERIGLPASLIPTAAITSARVSPMVWASLLSRPRLLLPAELWGRLDVSQQDAVLIHELAHLKRRDHWVRWLETIVLGIYWWNPVAWWARRELERTEEEACDAWVLSSRPTAASAYAEALIATTAFLAGISRQLPAGASGVTNTHSLKRRLRMLLSKSANMRTTRSRSWMLLVLGALCLPLLPVPSSGKTGGPLPAAPPRQTPGKNEQSKPKSLPEITSSSAPVKSRVRVARPITRRIGEYADVDGRLQAAARVEIKSAVGGFLNKVACKPAARVKKGDVLFEIDSRSYALELQKAEAEVRRLQSRVRNIGVQARAVDREKRGNPAEYVARVQAEHEEAEAMLLGAQATLDLAKLKLDSTKVSAPVDGVVHRVLQSEGDFVEAEKTSLARIFATNHMFAEFYVEEPVGQRIEEIRGNRENTAANFVRVAVRDEDGFPHPASIDFVDPEVQPVAETALRVRILVPNPDGSLRSGQAARIRMTFGPPRDSLLVPAEAVSMRRGRRFVYILNDQNVVDRRFVQAPLQYESLRAVESGLRAEEWVIIDGGAPELVGRAVERQYILRAQASPETTEKPPTD